MENTLKVLSLYSVPAYSLQSLSIRRRDHETCPREAFILPTAVLKLPDLIIRVGLQVQRLTTPHCALIQREDDHIKI